MIALFCSFKKKCWATPKQKCHANYFLYWPVLPPIRNRHFFLNRLQTKVLSNPMPPRLHSFSSLTYFIGRVGKSTDQRKKSLIYLQNHHSAKFSSQKSSKGHQKPFLGVQSFLYRGYFFVSGTRGPGFKSRRPDEFAVVGTPSD